MSAELNDLPAETSPADTDILYIVTDPAGSPTDAKVTKANLLSGKADNSAVVHLTGPETVAGVKTFSSDPIVPAETYGSGWNGSNEPPTKNDVYDKVETLAPIASPTFTGEPTAPSFQATGKTGATATPIRLAGGTASGAPASGAHLKGEIVFDDAGVGYYCTVAGTPGTWVSFGGGGGGGGSVATDAIWDAAGDLVYGTGSNTAARLAVGAALRVLRVNAGATAPEWADLSALYAPITQGGSLGYAQVTSNQGSITTETDLTGLSIAVTVGSGRRIKITGHTHPASSANSDTVQVNIKEGATTLMLDRVQLGQSSAGLMTLHSEVVLTPSAGSHTYKLSMTRDTGSGTITSSAGATFPAFILVEDIGT